MTLQNDKRVTSLIPFDEIEPDTIKQFEDVLSYDQVQQIAIMVPSKEIQEESNGVQKPGDTE